MRLLAVLPEYLPQQGGGIITFYRHLLPAIAAQGHHVEVLVGSAFTQGDEDGEAEGVRVRYLPERRFRSTLARFEAFAAVPEIQRHLAAARALWEMAEGGRGFDVVETTDWGLLFLPWVADAGSPPAVVQLHGSVGQIAERDPVRGQELAGWVARMLEGAGLSAAGELQSYSGSNAAEWRARLGREVTVIPPAWDGTLPEAEVPSGGHGLVVARVQRWKGPDVLCDALAQLGSAGPTVDWAGRDTMDGDTGGSYAATLAGRFPTVWGRSVRPIGPRSFAETDALRRRAAFAVVPSTWDMFNFTVVEAMAAGLPLICSDAAGACELVEDGVNGFAFPGGDARALASRLEQVAALADSERRKMGASARETVRRRLEPAAIAKARLERYARLAAGGPKSQAEPWLAEAVAPGATLPDPLAFLHHLPLRGLLRHAARRLAEKGGVR